MGGGRKKNSRARINVTLACLRLCASLLEQMMLWKNFLMMNFNIPLPSVIPPFCLTHYWGGFYMTDLQRMISQATVMQCVGPDLLSTAPQITLKHIYYQMKLWLCYSIFSE